jgi:hypothetical protein
MAHGSHRDTGDGRISSDPGLSPQFKVIPQTYSPDQGSGPATGVLQYVRKHA